MRAVDFKSVFARVTRATDDNILTINVYCLCCIELQILAILVQHLFHHRFCLGTLHGQLCIIVRAVVNGYIKTLGVFAHPGHILIDVGSVEDEEKLVFTHLVNQQVVYRSTVGVEHHAVKYLIDRRTCHIVGEDVVDISFGICACYVSLAHV